jgi:RHS repeat-associated protein
MFAIRLLWDFRFRPQSNRLTAINYPGTPPATNGRTEFTYDGLGRRVKLVEKDGNGAVQRTSNFVWDGMAMAEQRDSTGATVVKRFLPEGVQILANSFPNSKLYYSRDHLGSIRSLTNENGTVLSTLDYDAYGSISRAPVPANDTSGAGPTLISAVSRLTHGSAGTFDINLPVSGAPGIEMRTQGGNYTLVLTFDRPVVAATGGATIASGVGSANGVPVFIGNTATVLLSGMADRQTVTVELDNVVGVAGTTAKVFVAMSVLIGDVNQDGAVTVADVALIQAMTRHPVDSSTFTRDINANGLIDGNDVSAGATSDSQGAALFPDFAFTGHYYHARSGLYFTMYRAYNPSLGRWLSRDPIGEAGGVNLYGYVGNNAVNSVDSLGLLVQVYYESIGMGEHPDFRRMIAWLFGVHSFVRVQVPGQFDVTLELEGPRNYVSHGNPVITAFDPGRADRSEAVGPVARPCPDSDYSLEYNILDTFFAYYDNPETLPNYRDLTQNSNTFANYLVTNAGGSIDVIPAGAVGSRAAFTGGGPQIRLQIIDPKTAARGY